MDDKIYDSGSLDEITITPGLKFDFEEGKRVLFLLGYTRQQVDTISAQIDECNKQGIVLPAQAAYVLATNYHECYNWNDKRSRMTQLSEMGGDKYLRGKPYYPFYGRGPNHLTWKENYEKEGKRLGLDLVHNPDLMLDIRIGANSAVYCMKNGNYTGRKLSDYINKKKVDFIGARAIINGSDQAKLIAGYADEFLKCIKSN